MADPEHLSSTPDPNTVLSELLDAASQAEAQGNPVDDAVKADLFTAARFVHTEEIPHGGFRIPGTDEWIPGDVLRRYSYITIDADGNQTATYPIGEDVAQRVLAFRAANSTPETDDAQGTASGNGAPQASAPGVGPHLDQRGGDAGAAAYRRRERARQRGLRASSRVGAAATGQGGPSPLNMPKRSGAATTAAPGVPGGLAHGVGPAAGRHSRTGGGHGSPPRGSAPHPSSPHARSPESRKHSDEALPDRLEFLQAIEAEVDLVPVNARRVLDLQRLLKDAVSRNDHGVWVRQDGKPFLREAITNGNGHARQAVLATSEADEVLDSLLGNEAKGIVGKLHPESWLIEGDEKRREFSETMTADMFSPRHTSDADEARRRDEAQIIVRAGGDYDYRKPFGEGLIEEMAEVERLKRAPLNAALDAAERRIEHGANKALAWRSVFKQAGAQRIADHMDNTGLSRDEAASGVLSAGQYAAVRKQQDFRRLRDEFERPIRVYGDDGRPRSDADIARDVTARDKARRQLMSMLTRGERVLIRNDQVHPSQPKGWATQEISKLIARAERAARSTGREGIYHANLGRPLGVQAVKAYEAAGHVVNPYQSITEDQGAVILRWYQSQVLGRMKLHNEIIVLANIPMLARPIVGMEDVDVRGARLFDPDDYPGWVAMKAGATAAYDGDNAYIDQVHSLATREATVRQWLNIARGLPEGSDDASASESDKQRRVRFNRAKAAVKLAMEERIQDLFRALIPLDVAASTEQRQHTYQGTYDWSRWHLPDWAVEELIRQGKLTRSSSTPNGRRP